MLIFRSYKKLAIVSLVGAFLMFLPLMAASTSESFIQQGTPVFEQLSDVVLDSQGNIHILGTISGEDGFWLMKLSSDAQTHFYTTRILQGEMKVLKVDSQDRPYVVGSIDVDYFQPTPDAVDRLRGGQEGLIMRFNSDGIPTVISYFGGDGNEEINDLDFDSQGNLVLIGTTEAGLFTTPGVHQEEPAGGTDAFIAKLNPDASQIIWSTYMGTFTNERGLLVNSRADDSINIYGLNFQELGGFVASLNEDGTRRSSPVTVTYENVKFVGETAMSKWTDASFFKHVRISGGEGNVRLSDPSILVGTDYDLDSEGQMVLLYTKEFSGAPTPDVYWSALCGGFTQQQISKFGTNGENDLIWQSYSHCDFSFQKVALGLEDILVLFGISTLDHLETTPGVAFLTHTGGTDGVLMALNREGTDLEFASYFNTTLATTWEPQGDLFGLWNTSGGNANCGPVGAVDVLGLVCAINNPACASMASCFGN